MENRNNVVAIEQCAAGLGRPFNRLIFWYIGLFQRLLAVDPVGSRQEFEAWLAQDNTLFQPLRVWAYVLFDFLPPAVATRTLTALNDQAFWTERGQRDLLLSLKVRRDGRRRNFRDPDQFPRGRFGAALKWQIYEAACQTAGTGMARR